MQKVKEQFLQQKVFYVNFPIFFPLEGVFFIYSVSAFLQFSVDVIKIILQKGL